MAITPAELPGYLVPIKTRVEDSSVPVVDAIAETYEHHLVGFTLHESGAHPPVTQTPAPEGRPPAFMTGQLAGSVARTPGAGGGGIATATVAPHTIYAATIQWGGVHHGDMWLWVKYIGPSEVLRHNWRKQEVTIGARPYMDVAVDEEIANGELVRAGEARFLAVVWG